MKAVLYDFKTAKEPWFDEVSQVYLKKISAFWAFEIIHLKSPKQGRDDASAKMKAEEKELLSKLTNDDFIIVFDERGKSFNSLQFSEQLEKAVSSGKKKLVFIIGGAFGLSSDVQQKAHLKISLSSLVMNHLVAETVVLEQIYRALTIQNRIPYHNI